MSDVERSAGWPFQEGVVDPPGLDAAAAAHAFFTKNPMRTVS